MIPDAAIPQLRRHVFVNEEPTTGVRRGDISIDSAGTVKEWDGANWNTISTDGAGHVRLASSVYGNYPEYLQTTLSFTLADTANNDTSDISMYSWGIIYISGLTGGDTVNISSLGDGTNEDGDLLVRDNAGTLSAASALANGTYYFANASKKLRLNKTADAGADATVRIHLKASGAPL